jgi:ATP-dependent helicase/nuclease subunit B
MHRFLAQLGPGWPGAMVARGVWEAAMAEALSRAAPRPAVAAIWAPRLARIGAEVIRLEAAARPLLAESAAEVKGRLELVRAGGTLRLDARADRLDRFTDGNLRLVDYKTGTTPSALEVLRGSAPQLPLEALIAERGGFQGMEPGPVTALEYWRLTGALDPSEVKALKLDIPEAVEQAHAALGRLADRFLFGTEPFAAHPHPRRRAAPDYRHLSRADEWSAGEGGEP